MDTIILTLVISALTAAVVFAVGWKLYVWRDRSIIFTAVRGALAVRGNVVVGVIAALIYLFIYFVPGSRVHYFYGRVIWTTNLGEVVLSVVSAALVALVFAFFLESLRQLGLTDSKKGAWGVAGTLVAVIVSFCPGGFPAIAALVGAGGALALRQYWEVLTVISIGAMMVSILVMLNTLKKPETGGTGPAPQP